MDSLTQFLKDDPIPTTPEQREAMRGIRHHFADLAEKLMQLPSNPERTTARRKLLEAKDCAIRAYLYEAPPVGEMQYTGRGAEIR